MSSAPTARRGARTAPGLSLRVACLGLACASLWAVASRANYPIFSQRFTADPAPIVHGGRVYVFCSHDLDHQTWWEMIDFTAISSDDLVNWTDHGEVFNAPRDTVWADMAWAPAVVERAGRLYLYYTNARNGTGVAVADEILGPYVDPLGRALAGTGNYSDPAVFVDDDGRAYLHAKPALWGELNPDMVSLASPLVPYASSSFPDYAEGGIVHKIGGRYNVSYSTPPLDGYQRSYAQSVSDSPTRDFVPRGKWFWFAADNELNTHGDFFHFAGKSYMVYQNAAVAKDRGLPVGFQRSIAIDRIYLDGDGTIAYFTSTRDLMAQVKYLDPYVRVEAETMAAESWIETEPCPSGGRNVTSIENGDWIRLRGVDFGAGAGRFTAVVASEAGGGVIELRLDQPDGRLAGTCAVPATGGWQVWTSISCPVSGAAGVHDLYFVFSGPAGELLKFDWWRFDGGPASGRTPPPTVTKTVCLTSLGPFVHGGLTHREGGLPATSCPTRCREAHPRLEATPELCAASPPGVCDEPSSMLRLPASGEVGLLLDNQDGTWSFQGLPGRQYLAVVDHLTGAIGWSATNDLSARFVLVSNPDGTWCLRACNARFVVAEEGGLAASFDETQSGSPRKLADGRALFEIVACALDSMSACDLNAVDLKLAPIAPAPRAAYGNPCLRLDPSLPEGWIAVERRLVVPGVGFDTAMAGAGGTVTFYQLGCGCSDVIRLTKDAGGNRLVLE